jgi:hypothetical protein
MLSLIHTPIEDREAALALRLSPQWYSFARRRGALLKTYSDYNDELTRLHRHNTGDLLHFTVAAILGWPENDLSGMCDDVDYVFDVIAAIWEQIEPSSHYTSQLNATYFIEQFATRISESSELNALLDSAQRASLIDRIRSICFVLELIILRSQAANRSPQVAFIATRGVAGID